MSHFVYVVLLVSVVVSGCRTQKAVSSDNLKAGIEEKLEGDYKSVSNSSNTKVLAWEEDNSSGTKVIRFGVWEITSGNQVYYGSIIQGKVEWLSDTVLYLEDSKGIVVNGRQIFKYKLDLLTKKKTIINGKVDL